MRPAGFESAITARERPQTRSLDREPTGIKLPWLSPTNNFWSVSRLQRFTSHRHAMSILVFSSLVQGFQCGVVDYSSETVHQWNESVWPLTGSGTMHISTLMIISILITILRFIEKIMYSCSYVLTPWCRVLLEKLTDLQLVKELPAFHGTRRFITALTSLRHLSLSWASPIHIPTSHLLEIHSNIIHPSTSRSPQWFTSLPFPQQDPIHPRSCS